MYNININDKDIKYCYKYYKLGWKIKNNNSYNEFLLCNDNLKIKNIKINIYPNYYNLYKKYQDFFPTIINQLNIESCVSNCISIVYYYLCFKQNNFLKFILKY
jgi:hypothetical protein